MIILHFDQSMYIINSIIKWLKTDGIILIYSISVVHKLTQKMPLCTHYQVCNENKL